MALKRNRTAWRDGISQVTWQDFERLLAEHYRDAGYDVEHCGTAGVATRYDGGVDLILRRDGQTTLVQCKHWNAAQVPHNDVHQLLGLLETRDAQRAILVTSGEFTPAAHEAASRSRRIELVDGTQLRLMIDPRLIPTAPAVSAPSQNLEAWAPVAEKALDAFMGVRFGRRGRSGRRTPGQELKDLGLRLLFGAVVAIAAVLFIRHQFEKLHAAPGRPAAAAPLASDRTIPQVDPLVRQRLREVKVQGVMVSAGQQVVVVELAGLQASDVRVEICREAEHWVRHSLSGERIRVQRVRGNNPAVEAGVIRCD